MQISFASKTVDITDKMKLFFVKKLARLEKFSSLKIEQLQIVIDRVKRGGRSSSGAQIEIIAKLRGHRFAFKEVGENIYQAFYRIYETVEGKLRSEMDQGRFRGRRN